MTTLHMEIEAMLAVQRELITMQNQLNRYTQYMNNYVYGLPSDWQADSATEFFGYYEDWRSAITGVAGTLGDIAERLSAAIADWEAADHSF